MHSYSWHVVELESEHESPVWKAVPYAHVTQWHRAPCVARNKNPKYFILDDLIHECSWCHSQAPVLFQALHKQHLLSSYSGEERVAVFTMHRTPCVAGTLRLLRDATADNWQTPSPVCFSFTHFPLCFLSLVKDFNSLFTSEPAQLCDWEPTPLMESLYHEAYNFSV